MEQALEREIVRVRGSAVTAQRDRVAIERPLQIRVRVSGVERVLSTTMRTPGQDGPLAAGFLYAEGAIAGAASVLAIDQPDADAIVVELEAASAAVLDASERRFLTSAACGVCGRTSLDGMARAGAVTGDAGAPRIEAAVIHGLPEALRRAQITFERTGGLHAAGLFSRAGVLEGMFEDVGRHNAVDKLVGTLLLAGRLPASDGVLVVSGRASFELVQKAEAAGIPVLAAVGAPSSLAIDRAAEAKMTLLGFVRDGGFNVYCGADRIAGL